MSLIERAEIFAEKAHGSIGQRREYTGEPYINHPRAVAKLVSSVPHTEEMVAAAWLHDVVEDTPATIEMIEEQFGPTVSLLVQSLTDVSCGEDGSRAIRKEIDRQHIAKASPQAKTVKLADLIDNTKSIVERDPGFAKIYLKEKRLLLDVLKDGDCTLWKMANEQTQEVEHEPNK